MNVETIVSDKFQVVIPKDIREQIKLHEREKLHCSVTRQGNILLSRTRQPKRPLSQLFVRLRGIRIEPFNPKVQPPEFP
jgi:AbrB family looped-hinge helix DNA binding protein